MQKVKMRDGGMAVQQWQHWLCPLVAETLLLLSLPLCGAAATTLQSQTYTYDSLQEVADIPIEGVTRLCVVPFDDNTRLKVRHTDAEGGRQEVVVKKKSLSADTLNVLEIEVEPDGADKATLSVRLNGTQLQLPDDVVRPTRLTSPWPRTALMLKGNARITNCTATTEESVTLGSGTKLRMLTVTERKEGENVTEEQGGEVTEGHEGEKVTEGKGGEEVVSSTASLPPLPSSASTKVTANTEDPKSGEEEPWWSFLLVLGKVGEVPVLMLLLACLLVGVVVGSILVCLCSKVCQKRRVEYHPVSSRMTHSDHIAVDTVKDTVFWDTLSSKRQSSGIGSTYSTLNTDNGSHMGTTNSRGTGTRLAGSPNNSIDRSTRGPTHIGVNNLGRGPTGSPSSSINRNNSSGNVLNIPYGSGMTRSGSSRSTNSSENRDVDRSPMLLQSGRVAHTSSNKSTSSSINRNTNRSPNIPYSNKLAILAGHQDAPFLQNPINRHNDLDDNSDDSNYDKPYISPPILADNYSVPHGSTVQPVFVELRTTVPSSNDPTAPQVPVYQFGTFKK